MSIWKEARRGDGIKIYKMYFHKLRWGFKSIPLLQSRDMEDDYFKGCCFQWRCHGSLISIAKANKRMCIRRSSIVFIITCERPITKEAQHPIHIVDGGKVPNNENSITSENERSNQVAKDRTLLQLPLESLND